VITLATLSLKVEPVKAIPESNKLIVPYHSQFESKDPNSGSFCCVASAAMVLEYISGQAIPQTTLASELGTGWATGTQEDNIHLVFERRNYNAVKVIDDLKTFREAYDNLKSLNALGYLSIITILSSVTKLWGGHCIVVTGYNQTGIFVNDPWPPWGHGQPRDRRTGMNAFISEDLLANLWIPKNNWLLKIPYPTHMKEFSIPLAGIKEFLILNDQFTISGTRGIYCDQINTVQLRSDQQIVNASLIHISFVANQSVNFWILDQAQYSAWYKSSTCSGRLGTPSVLTLTDRSIYDNSTVQIQQTANYHFAFDNPNYGPVSVNFEVDYSSQASTTTTASPSVMTGISYDYGTVGTSTLVQQTLMNSDPRTNPYLTNHRVF
jgi:hypothetical protein